MTIEARRCAGVVRSLAFAAILAIVGCGEHELGPEFATRTVEMKEVPASVLDAAKKQLPTVDFRDAWKNVGPDGKLHSYEIKGRATNGKIREVRVSPTGEILEME